MNLREKRVRDKKGRRGGPGKRKCFLSQVAWLREGRGERWGGIAVGRRGGQGCEVLFLRIVADFEL